MSMRLLGTAAILGLTLAAVTLSWAEETAKEQSPPPAAAEPAKPADAATTEQPPKPAAGSTQPTAEEVLDQLLKRRAENPLIEPAPREGSPAGATAKPAPARSAVTTGAAPGATAAPLKREGQFIVTRRGRMVRAAGGVTPWVFAFEADSNGLSDPPMYVMPCQMLEDMEAIVTQHGDSLVFVLSGQVFTYRGANYLLPTLMKLAPQRGNLQP